MCSPDVQTVAHLNITMADYDGGMREHIPLKHRRRRKKHNEDCKDERRLELKARGPALNITRPKTKLPGGGVGWWGGGV